MQSSTLTNKIPPTAAIRLFWGFGLLVMVSIWAAIALEQIWWVGLPMAMLVVFQTVVDYQKLYWLLWACIPISTEITLPNGMGTDLPVEPLIVGLMLVYFLQLMSRPDKVSGAFFRNPVTLLVLAHVVWIAITAIVSENVVVSIKFLLAKIWYIVTFYFLTGHIIRNERQVERALWWFFIPFVLAVIKVVIHHAWLDWGFKEINTAVVPFFRNHVNYAALLALSLPLAWFMRTWYARWSLAWWLVWIGMAILFFALLFAYTRAAYIALAMAAGAYWVIRFGLVRWVLAGATVAILFVFGYLVRNNKFMDYAPTERTIAHADFNDIVAATYKLEDVSTMERYYRWVAGVRMANEDLLFGYGAGNFYNFYKAYTLNRFETYVSNNPEQSGIHNYYLMLLVEQGILGVLIFVALNFMVLLYGERLYHQLINPRQQTIAMAVMLSEIVIYAFLLMNDMIETDKVGSFFFFNMAVLVSLDTWGAKKTLRQA